MSPDVQTELARRLVACEQWRWMSGMLASDGHRLDEVDCDEHPWAYGVLPDLLDAATCGCLLAMLRAVPGVTRVETWSHGTGAAVRFDEDDLSPDEDMSWLHAATLGEALSRALLAVWEGDDA